MRRVILLLICAWTARGFAPAPPATRRGVALNAQNGGGNPLSKIPVGSIVLGVLGLQCLQDLAVEVPSLGGESADYIGTALDVFFLGYAGKTLLEQTGAVRSLGGSGASLAGLRCGATLSVGREPATWMPKDWAASGARLSLPLQLEFADDDLDLGFPGEEALGGRFCKRLECGGGTFVGPSGTVVVACDGGGWATAPAGKTGESSVRFFLDFPEGAARNDVTLPAGRVFFSSAAFDGDLDEEIEAQIPASDILAAPNGVKLVNSGGLSIKKQNNFLNLYGALGDVNLILGRYELSAPRVDAGDRAPAQPAPPPAPPPTPDSTQFTRRGALAAVATSPSAATAAMVAIAPDPWPVADAASAYAWYPILAAGAESLDGLVRDWASASDGDAVRRVLGTVGTTSPLYKVRPALAAVLKAGDLPDAVDVAAAAEAAEEFLSLYQAADGAAYGANFADYSTSVGRNGESPSETQLKDARRYATRARDQLDRLLSLLAPLKGGR